MKYILETYGCQMNVAESNALELQLKGAGLEKTELSEEADVAILNTCSVRKSAESRIWGRLSHYAHLKKSRRLILIVTGCMAERLKEDLKKDAPFVDAVIGTNEKVEIVNFILGGGIGKEEKYSFLKSYHNEGEFSSFVPIINGCNNFCTYCIVPYVRGREIMRSSADIFAEIDYLDSVGVREVTLLGQNVNSYRSGDYDFPSLLEAIAARCRNIEWIRFESPHPKDFSDRLISVIAKEEKVAKHIHLPMQSGNTRILHLMNRKNTRESFISLVEKMRSEIPRLTFATDVMVGFPSETEDEYLDTLSMMDIMNPLEAFMYYYNLREGTPAAKMEGQIDEKTKTERLERLINEQLSRTAVAKKARLPQTAKFIVTGIPRDDKDCYLARSEHNEMVSFIPKTAHKNGDVVMVECTALKGNTYNGKEV
jgi:tRNA-N(6)-(isopentenyl)adenosine-37 thiotransferase enzyme MiaB